MGKKLIVGLIIIAVAFAIFFATRFYYKMGETTVQEQSQVLMESVKAVAKLITVEGYFSEIYDYEDYPEYDFGLFGKKALIRVKAKVSVGYDLTAMRVDAIPEKKLLIISDLPDPAIISIDHELDYYDITEGFFTSFTEEEYTMMNRNAKEKVRKAALSSDLFLAAEEQSNKMHDLMKFMVEGAGWQLQFQPRGGAIQVDTLKN